MGTIYIPEDQKVRLLQSEKTSFPTLRQLPNGMRHEDFAEGEFVGQQAMAGGNRVAHKVQSEAEAADQVTRALIRIDTNSNVTRESGAISCQKGFYELSTRIYLPDQAYAVDQELTLRYFDDPDSDFEGGVLGPVTEDTQHVIARIDVAPRDASTETPMEVTVFPPRLRTPAS